MMWRNAIAIVCVNKHVAKLFHVCVGMYTYSVVAAGVSGESTFMHVCVQCVYVWVWVSGCGYMCTCVPVYMYNIYICIHCRHVFYTLLCLRLGR